MSGHRPTAHCAFCGRAHSSKRPMIALAAGTTTCSRCYETVDAELSRRGLRVIDAYSPEFLTDIYREITAVRVLPTHEATSIMDATVKLYQSDEGFAIYTDAADERDFIEAAAAAVADEVIDQDAMAAYLPRIVDIVCKLRGYKAPTVIEKRVLISGPGVLPESAIMVEANRRGVVRVEAA